MHLKKWIAVVVVAFAIPVVYLAASAHAAQHVPTVGVQFAQDQTPTPAPSATRAPSAEPTAAPESERNSCARSRFRPRLYTSAPLHGTQFPQVAVAPVMPVGPDRPSRARAGRGANRRRS